MEYPKIQTLYNRDKKTFKVIDDIRCPEFNIISEWIITEKIHGTNVRIQWTRDSHQVDFYGRTDKAQIPPFLLEKLNSMFSDELFCRAFEIDGECPYGVILFGEGYGNKIQKEGSKYRDDVSFRLFDVFIENGELSRGKWLNWLDVEDVAHKLGILTVPVVGMLYDIDETDNTDLRDFFLDGGHVDKGGFVEGIVARTDPLVFDWRGNRIMWKLKFSDFGG